MIREMFLNYRSKAYMKDESILDSKTDRQPYTQYIWNSIPQILWKLYKNSCAQRKSITHIKITLISQRSDSKLFIRIPKKKIHFLISTILSHTSVVLIIVRQIRHQLYIQLLSALIKILPTNFPTNFIILTKNNAVFNQFINPDKTRSRMR